MEPSSLTKMNNAEAEVPFFVTWKNPVLLKTCPVGFPVPLLRAAVGIHLMKVFIEGMDLPCMEICRIQEIVTVGNAEGCALVDGAVNAAVCAVVDRNNGVRWVHGRVPT